MEDVIKAEAKPVIKNTPATSVRIVENFNVEPRELYSKKKIVCSHHLAHFCVVCAKRNCTTPKKLEWKTICLFLKNFVKKTYTFSVLNASYKLGLPKKTYIACIHVI